LIHPISNGVTLDVERQKSGRMAPPNTNLYIKLVPVLPGLTESKLSLSLIICSNFRLCVLST
jgi:hypothetical protein